MTKQAVKKYLLICITYSFTVASIQSAFVTPSGGPNVSSSSSSSSSLQPVSRGTCHQVLNEKVSKFPQTIPGPPIETKPDYENIHGPLGKKMDDIFLSVFRSKLAERVGVDSKLPKDSYEGLMELTAALNSRYSDRRDVQQISKDTLVSLFPPFILQWFPILFARPFPEFSMRMNAWATNFAGTWLMGECEVNDCDIDGGGIGENQGLLVKRCRFLEESSCASVCINACKIPTQRFFSEEMGLPLTMTPDYETGECQFSFGLTPTSEMDLEASTTPCLSRCPSAGGMRMWHTGGDPKMRPVSQCSLLPLDDYIDSPVKE